MIRWRVLNAVAKKPEDVTTLIPNVPTNFTRSEAARMARQLRTGNRQSMRFGKMSRPGEDGVNVLLNPRRAERNPRIS